MANSFSTTESKHSKVYGSIDTTGASTPIEVTGARLVDLSLDYTQGTFVGSVALQRRTNTGSGNEMEWRTIATYTDGAEITFRSATTREYRINVTVSSGILYFEMTAGNKEGN